MGRVGLVCLIGLVGRATGVPAELEKWAAGDAEIFGAALLEGVQVHSDSLVILASLSAQENLALGRPVRDDTDRLAPLTDGSIAAPSSEWNSGSPQVFGRSFAVDLGVDRAVDRVRILAGESAVSIWPEYFVRGYRIESATQMRPDIWRTVAEEKENFELNVDTREDDTWLQADARGDAVPAIGRHVRLTLIRQDRSNWVVLGELEVYGTGYRSEGSIVGEFVAAEPVNVGRIRWGGETPPQTGLRMQFRGPDESQAAPGWEESVEYATPEVLFPGAEPTALVQYRGRLESSAPYATPALREVEVDYDPVLVARQALGSVAADSVEMGKRTPVSYRAELQVEPGDHGVDLVSLGGAPIEVHEVRFEDAELSFQAGPDQEGRTLIELDPAERIVTSGTLEIAGQALFLQDPTAVVLRVASRGQEDRDGYLNWQNGREDPASTWVVRASGRLPGLLSEVEFGPRPFSPLDSGGMEFRFVVGFLRDQTEVAVSIFSLEGRRVRKLARVGGTGEYRMSWNGRDRDNRIVEPGLYLFEVRVEAGDSTSRRRGALVVAY